MVYAYIQDVPIDEKTVPARSSTTSARNRCPACCCTCASGDRRARLRYIDVWESKSSCKRAFEERIHPAVDAAFGGNRPANEPTVHRLDVVDANGALLGAVGASAPVLSPD